jgi:hypothetical protein
MHFPGHEHRDRYGQFQHFPRIWVPTPQRCTHEVLTPCNIMTIATRRQELSHGRSAVPRARSVQPAYREGSAMQDINDTADKPLVCAVKQSV